MTYIVRNL